MSLAQAPLLVEASEAPPLLLTPEADLFGRRAEAFLSLSAGHGLGDWLVFLGRISAVQQQLLDQIEGSGGLALPTQAALAQARDHRMPPLASPHWQAPPLWRDCLRQLANELQPLAPPLGQQALRQLTDLSDEALDALADQVLTCRQSDDPLMTGTLPYVGAALQVVSTAAARVLAGELKAIDAAGVCPCCGFLPVAAVLQDAGDVSGLRYLHCALCNCRWNLVRVTCAACGSTAGISYRELSAEGKPATGAVRAETCDACKGYLKIVNPAKGGRDPVADDLASLALDLLLDEAGYQRFSPNLLLVAANG